MNESSHGNCETCAYYATVSAGNGECRRYAPQPNRTVFVGRMDATGKYKTDIHWPKVYESNWCGEYKAKG